MLLECDGEQLGEVGGSGALDELLEDAAIVRGQPADGDLGGGLGGLAAAWLVFEQPPGRGRGRVLLVPGGDEVGDPVVGLLDCGEGDVEVGLSPAAGVGAGSVAQPDRQGDDEPAVAAGPGRAW